MVYTWQAASGSLFKETLREQNLVLNSLKKHFLSSQGLSKEDPGALGRSNKYGLHLASGLRVPFQGDPEGTKPGKRPQGSLFKDTLREQKTVDLMFFNKPSDAGKDLGDRTNPAQILNLFDVVGDVAVNKSGQTGETPQKDKEKPSPKVKENNDERFKH